MMKSSSKRAVKKSSGLDCHAKRHDRVIFEFYNMDVANDFIGSVADNGDEMTIEIPAQSGTRHCLVKGFCKGHVFRGRNSSREPDPVTVDATWCDIGDGYLCLWIEEGTEYVVRFKLPR